MVSESDVFIKGIEEKSELWIYNHPYISTFNLYNKPSIQYSETQSLKVQTWEQSCLGLNLTSATY